MKGLVLLFAIVSAQSWLNISSGSYTLGLDLALGGYIGYFGRANNSVSAVNIHDAGRGIQMSFYAGPSGYDNCTFNGQLWPWNPISGGDRFGHASRILNATRSPDASAAHVVIRPLQWACDNVPCECEFAKRLSFLPHLPWAVRVEAQLLSHRSDRSVYPTRDQELPAVYVPGAMCSLSCYQGDQPFSFGHILTKSLLFLLL